MNIKIHENEILSILHSGRGVEMELHNPSAPISPFINVYENIMGIEKTSGKPSPIASRKQEG